MLDAESLTLHKKKQITGFGHSTRGPDNRQMNIPVPAYNPKREKFYSEKINRLPPPVRLDIRIHTLLICAVPKHLSAPGDGMHIRKIATSLMVHPSLSLRAASSTPTAAPPQAPQGMMGVVGASHSRSLVPQLPRLVFRPLV